MRSNSFLSKFTATKPLDSTTASLFDSIREVLRTILSRQLIDGYIIYQDLAVGSNLVQHKLQRDYVGWIVVQVFNGTVIYEESSPDKSSFLKLNSSLAASVTIWVF